MRNRYSYMNSHNNGSAGGGVGILTVIQIVFIILKLIDIINWPWTIVLIPTWIGLSFTAFIGLLWLLVIAFHAWRKK